MSLLTLRKLEFLRQSKRLETELETVNLLKGAKLTLIKYRLAIAMNGAVSIGSTAAMDVSAETFCLSFISLIVR